MNIPFNNDWLFTESFESGFENAERVRLPHTVKEIPYNYADCTEYQLLCGYQKSFLAPAEWADKSVVLRFDGAAHDAVIYCNGHEAAHHSCGYTAFSADLSPYLVFGAENTVTVRLDTRESLNIPPFGYVIDYLCYGGLYREVTLMVREKAHIEDVFIENTTENAISVRIALSEKTGGKLLSEIRDADGNAVASAIGESFTLSVPEAKLWSLEHPYLYTLNTKLLVGKVVVNEKETRFGFRSARFENDGFYLNGERIKLRGLNRHQSYPYVGYAMPASMQRLDADILKNEIGVNAVRTSHYPQSQHFIDRCDELGILVFTEIPGWQHIGDEDWKKQAVENTREMVTQYMHHPSVVLWGVRINESQDDDKLYKQTNAVAHELDSSRQTSGVRYLEKSHLLEDVYAFNDFSHCGDNAGLRAKKDVSSKKNKPYLVSECNGHMFPTKMFDDERHRLAHALRHSKVIDAMYAADDICGIFPWCMFDYNTHRDFGSGDGVCYHGVLDMFRNPKLAAAVYASQSDAVPCCVVSSSMDIGEHPAGDLGSVYVFTNADSVKLYKNDIFVNEYLPDREGYPAMPHPPVVISDFIGNMLETQEHYDPNTAETIKGCLEAIKIHGPSAIPLKNMLQIGKLMLLKGFKFSDGVELYGKYVGNWGVEATVWRFDAVKDGQVVSSVTKKPGQRVHIHVEADHTELTEGSTYDVAAVRITALDECGCVAPYYQEPVMLRCGEGLEIIGPELISLKGGCGGTYVKTTGKTGSFELFVNEQKLIFRVK